MRRGQAITELALLMLVFVTVLMFGIHFAEVHSLAIRSQEAAHAGLFDTTAAKMHDTSTGNWGYAEVAIRTAAQATLENYADREGRHAAPSKKLADWVFTRADEVEMECGGEPGIDLAPVDPLGKSLPRGDTALSCSAGIAVMGIRLPFSFVDQGPGTFFKHPHKEDLIFGLCAAGRASNMDCKQAYAILLDDWGYSGPEERKECHLMHEGGEECSNRGYWHMVKRSYEEQIDKEANGMRPAGSELAEHTVGESPIDENHFYLSYRGSESDYTETVKKSHHQLEWETTPWSDPAAYKNSRRGTAERCWLGLECP